jgi:hypothetical protein
LASPLAIVKTVDQCLCGFEIVSFETLGEPVVDWREKRNRLCAPILDRRVRSDRRREGSHRAAEGSWALQASSTRSPIPIEKRVADQASAAPSELKSGGSGSAWERDSKIGSDAFAMTRSIYAAVVLAGFGLGRPLDIAGQSDKLMDVFSIGFAVRCLEECWVCCRPTWRSTSARQTPSST